MMETWTELVHKMHTMGIKSGECLELLQKAFIYSSSESLDACLTKLAAIRSSEPKLSKEVREMARQKMDREVFADIPRHFLVICDQLDILAETLKKKIDGNILFSDRAITEISFLSQSLMEILKAASDLVLVKNPILLRYVEESEARLTRATSEYATHHEERLIEGLCLPVASSVFLKILETMKAIAHEAKEIANSMSA
jgi:Na+/phosphate symporter